jgi:protein TonB
MQNRLFKSLMVSVFLHVMLFAGFIKYENPKEVSTVKTVTMQMDYTVIEPPKEVRPKPKKEPVKPPPKPKPKPKPVKKEPIVKEPVMPKEPEPEPEPKEEIVQKKVAPKPDTTQIKKEQDQAMQQMQKAFVQSNFAIIRDMVLSNLTYPKMAKRMGHTGIVEVTLVVSQKGMLKRYFVSKSSGSKMLDGAALEAVEKIKHAAFPKPPKHTTIILPIGFELS